MDNSIDDEDKEYLNDEYEEDNSTKNETFPISNGVIYLKEDQLMNDRDKVIIEAMEIICLGREETILALIYFNWSIEKLQEKWFDDVESYKIKCGINISPKIEKKLQGEKVEVNGECCLICYENKNKSTFYSLSCGHQFCENCWVEYIKEKSKDFLILLTSTCPQKGCNCIIPEALMFTLLSGNKPLTDKIYKAINKNFTDNNDDIKLCPNPQCTICIKNFTHIAMDIECLCGTSFCWKCYRESHKPCLCEMVEKWEARLKSDSADDMWMKANTKTCPHCNQKIEKSTGCNYLFCDPRVGGCGKAFCYVCESDWKYHSQDHFRCNKYTEQVKKKEKEADKLKLKLKRYSFYFDRYINYRNAVELCKNKLRKQLEEKINIIILIKGIAVSELQFFEQALNAVIKGKRCLKNTYIFGYYLPDDKKKELFEFSQGLLERNAENLHQLIEQDEINSIINHDTFEVWMKMFENFKNKVLNLTAATLKFEKNLSNEIEMDFTPHLSQELLDEKL